MSAQNRKINSREREIGVRLKVFRTGIKYSQASFAEIIGLSRDQLASVEYGRTPLKYGVAWRIRLAFGLSMDWLRGGDMSPDDLGEDRLLPHPDYGGVGNNALFTRVLDGIYPLSGDAPFSRTKRRPRVDPTELAHRWLMLLALRDRLELWIASLPDGYTRNFAGQLDRFAGDYLKSFPANPPELIQARLDGLRWEKMRADAARKVPGMLSSLPKPGNKPAVAEKVKRLTTAGVPEPALPRLLKRLSQATQERGYKTQLAAWLGVHRQMVTDWLSGKQKPGGETTLQLLQWIEQQVQ
jgi:transcriptional regulator with XRE-family HTH domain